MRELCQNKKMQLLIGQVTRYEVEHDRISKIVVTDIDGQDHQMAVDDLLIFFGLSPKLGPIADWGLDIDRKQVTVDTEKFQTSIPGIYAVGDVNTYENKLKLILCGFHEGTLAVQSAFARIHPEKKNVLKYTTVNGVNGF